MLNSCNTPNIIGHWQTDPKPQYKNIDSTFAINPHVGDLTLFSDSTYLLIGFGSNYSNTPGWHVGGDEKGIWKGSTVESLVLFPDSYSSLIPASWETLGRTSFKIIHLSQTELVLSPLDSTRGMRIDSLMKYKR